jgi:hypothetical protein
MFELDYNKTEQDAATLKQYLISQIGRFKSADDLHNYVVGEPPYYVSECKDFWSNVLQLAKKQSNAEGMDLINYFNFIADRDFTRVLNDGLKTRKRKTVDWEQFYKKYSM